MISDTSVKNGILLRLLVITMFVIPFACEQYDDPLEEDWDDDELEERAKTRKSGCEGKCSPSCKCGWTEIGCKTDSGCQTGLYCKMRPQLGNRCLKKKNSDANNNNNNDNGGDGDKDGDDHSWVCGEKGNGDRSCSSGNDLKLIIDAKRSGNRIRFQAKERLMDNITFTVEGTRITQGPDWMNFDGRSSSSNCERLNCGSGVYLCIIAHDDPQDFRAPSGARKVAHKKGHGNSVTAIVGKNWNGGRVSNSGSTDGGNNEITAAFCVK